jgi:hypothetical protein
MDGGITSVMLVGELRAPQQRLSDMSHVDKRNTLIAELAARTRDTVGYYQSLDDAELAGVGALLVYLRAIGNRTDQQIRMLSADDMRDIVMIDAAAHTSRSGDLRHYDNMELVQLLLGEIRQSSAAGYCWWVTSVRGSD